MEAELSTKALAQLCLEIVDCPHSTPVWTDAGKVVLRSQNIRNGRLDLSQTSFTDSEHFERRVKRARPVPGDLVITREAPMGEVCMIPAGVECCLGQRMVLLRPNPDEVDGRYLLYALQSPTVQHEISTSEGTGSTVSNLRIPLLEALRIPWRPLPEQRRIAHILGTLDDKIELNRRMNETLEEMARALFKSWFVDFDPVRAKAGGRDPGLPKHLADLFPDRLIDSELGEIPEGWTAGRLGDIAEQVSRGVKPEEIPAGTPYVALEHMPRRSIALAHWSIADAVGSGKSEFHKGEVLFGKLRPYFHKVAVAPIDGVCSTDIVVLRAKESAWTGFILHLVSSDLFVDFTSARAVGTRMPRTSWPDMATFDVAVPHGTVSAAFDVIVDSIAGRLSASSHHAKTLRGLRDSLLRKLICDSAERT